MKKMKGLPHRVICLLLLLVFAAMSVTLFSGCPPTATTTAAPLSKTEAATIVNTTLVEDIWANADQQKGLRVQQYPELLAAGTRVQPAVAAAGEPAALECQNDCWLFFIDEQPGAHFAHPTQIVLLDAQTEELQVLPANWWPLIDGKATFATTTERNDTATIIFDQAPALATEVKPFEVTGPEVAIKLHDPCSAWAVIVCGYDDLPDTFDEDTEGIYAVLIGLGLADDHIFFVSPHTGTAGVDVATSIANVEWAINQVAASADETDKVLFFYSSHGGTDSLSCVPGSPGGGSISASDLDSWLDGITCDEMTIIIEACHSGSLIGRYADGTYVAAEDDLTGDGETNRCIFTSASTDTSSYADVDWAGDPNPGDSGSETIWGYVEAFGTAAADTNGDGEISFGEGYQYAWDNDITRITGVNTPQMDDTGLVADNVYNYCYSTTTGGDLFVSDGPADVGHNSYDYDSTDIWVTQDPAETTHHDVVSGMDNLVNVAVHNRGTATISNGTLKVYWADTSTSPAWPGDFTQIGSTHTFASLAAGDTETYTWTWYVDPSIGLGHHFCLVAVADSPDDPMVGGPGNYVAPFDNNIGQKNIDIVEDHGTGHATVDFALQNPTQADSVDLVFRWVGDPWGSVMLTLPDDLFAFVRGGAAKLDGLKIVEAPGQVAALEITGLTQARITGIPLKSGESRIVSLDIQTNKTGLGQRSELRIWQEVDGVVIGAVTVRVQQVDPADCGWVTRNSVTAFADLAVRFDISAAKTVSEVFAGAVSGGLCNDEKALLGVLSEAQLLERDIGQILQGTHADTANPEAMETYLAALADLEKALDAGDLAAALLAQGAIAEAVKDL